MSDELNPYQAPIVVDFEAAPAKTPGEPCEFTESQRVRIAKLAGRLQFVGGATLALTILGTIMQVAQKNYPGILGNLFQLAAGFYALQSGSAFRRVLVARSNPLPEMRRALEHLRGFYTVYVVLLVLLLLLVVGGIALVFLGLNARLR